MKLSTGKVAFYIEFDNGDKECIYFNPNDPNLAIKLKSLNDNIAERIKIAKDIELNEDGTPKRAEMIKDVITTQTILYEELDKVFGAGTSAIAFKHCSPFAVVNGEFFIKQFMDALTVDIQKANKKINAEFEKKMRKHLDKWLK